MDGKSILIIEDTLDDYKRISKYLPQYACWPLDENDFHTMKMHLQNFFLSEDNGESTKRKKDAESFFSKFFQNNKFDAIILDINLLPPDNDTSGLKFLKNPLRKHYKTTPIIMLSRFSIDIVRTGLVEADGMANYFLEKGGDIGYLSDEFFENKLNPILTMLIYWKETTTDENVIDTALAKHDLRIIERIEKLYGKITIELKQSVSDLAELKKYANCSLGILRYHSKIDNQKAGKLADKLIEEFEFCDNVPKLEENKKNIVEYLKDTREDIVKIIKGEINAELSDFLESSLRDVLDLGKDDSLSWEIVKNVCRFSSKNIKMLLV